MKTGDYVKIVGERGWWRIDSKRRGWLRLVQERGKTEDMISALETTVTAVAKRPPSRRKPDKLSDQ